MYKKEREREFLIFMENMQNEESPSLTKFYDDLVRRDEEVLDANVARMSNAQLIEFYDYCVEKSEETEKEGCELYFYACILLEERSIIKMYKNGQLDNGITFDEEDIPYMTDIEVTEDDIAEINRIVELLEQRKKAKKNPIKRLVKFFKG
jgi:hypothetical protein